MTNTDDDNDIVDYREFEIIKAGRCGYRTVN